LKWHGILRSPPVLHLYDSYAPENLSVLFSINGNIFAHEPGNIFSSYPSLGL
jgi:hypothetical protein